MSDQQIKMAILDNDNESTKVKFVTNEFGAAMRDACLKSGLKQKELANRTQLQVADIQKYENGTATPNQAHISKIQRVWVKILVNLIRSNFSKLNKK